VKNNDAEHLVVLINNERFFNGNRLLPSQMVWQCTFEGCPSLPKIRRRSQYKNKLLCNTCSNRLKSQNPELVAKRGKAISQSINNARDKWSKIAKKNMSNQLIRDKISKSLKKYIQENKEAIQIRRETAIKNNQKSNFGTSKFGKEIWSKRSEKERKTLFFRSTKSNKTINREKHINLVSNRYPGFKVIEFSSIANVYECPKGHTFVMRGDNFLKRGNCTVCAPKSAIELNSFTWIKEYLPNAQRNRRVLYLDESKNGNKALEIDIYDESKKIGIEVHGLYYHSEEKVGNVHQLKAELAEKEGITLIQLFEDEIIHKLPIVKSIIKYKAGLVTHKIGARKCKVSLIDDPIIFLNENHLQGHCRSFLRAGLFYKKELISVLTIRKPRKSAPNVVEIARFCNKLDIVVVGGFSKLLNFTKEILIKMGYETLITYSDRRYGNGFLYKNNGFEFVKFTDPDMFWVHKGERFPRQISWGKTVEQMNKEGYYKILGAGHSLWKMKLI